MRSRKRLLKPMLLLFTFAIAVGVPLFLLLMALSDAIDASPQPLLGFGCAFGACLILLLLYPAARMLRLRKRGVRRYPDRCLDTIELRSEVSLVPVLTLNLLYAVFKFGAAMYYRTLLFTAEAFFYLVLSAIRLLLVFNAYAGRRCGSGLISAWKSYRNCGWQLLILSLSMSFVILQSLRQRTDYVSLTVVVYGSAFWAFYRLTVAIVQLIRFRGADRPFLSASKLISLSAALMSIFILQNTLLLHFGTDDAFRQQMNTGFGIAISLTVILIASYMVSHGSIRLKRLHVALPTPIEG